MNNFTKSFKKIIPYIRKSTMEIIEQNSLKGEKLLIPGRECDIEVFLHKAKEKNAPVLFEFHGGGFVLGDTRKNDTLREIIKNKADINVVGVNYRKAPEYPHPTAMNDAFDVIKYFHIHAGEFEVDNSRFGVIGFSAGANLATITAMQAVATKEFSLKCQLLFYPYVDGASNPEEKKSHCADLPSEVMAAFTELYAGATDYSNPYISPLFAKKEQLKDVAPAVLFMAEKDALCKEGILYSEKLLQAGVPVIAEVVSDMHHGYMEDYFNQPCYNMLPEDTKSLHSTNMKQKAKESLHNAIKGWKYYLSK